MQRAANTFFLVSSSLWFLALVIFWLLETDLFDSWGIIHYGFRHGMPATFVYSLFVLLPIGVVLSIVHTVVFVKWLRKPVKLKWMHPVLAIMQIALPLWFFYRY